MYKNRAVATCCVLGGRARAVKRRKWAALARTLVRRERLAHSSSVSAASYLPWRRYSAPRFFSVVVTVGLQHTHTHKSRDCLHPQSSCSWRQRLTLCSTQWCLTQCKHQIAPNLVAQNFPVGTAPTITRPSMGYFAQFCYLSTFAALCQPP